MKDKIVTYSLDEGQVEVAILYGGRSELSPKKYMDEKVSAFTNGSPHNEFWEISLTNPYLRLIIKGIKNIIFKPYSNDSNVWIYESKLEDDVYISLLICDPRNGDAERIILNAVCDYVCDIDSYVEFMERRLDSPYFRVIISNMDKIDNWDNL